MNDARRAYDRTARALHETELRIASIEHRNAGGVDAEILPSLIRKRDRLTAEAISLKPAADAERADRYTSRAGTHIEFRKPEWQPAGTVAIDNDATDEIPAFLRRVS